ncbi:phytanoyl-CoA dioxygenase family protein [Pigmentiphaga sp. D-2]|uniref:phytanoyl-CoA dioxygenase family protein n=1 Tax=Pigmentiphaga sp. D-2 TaxID=1002116 RepID=UPI0014053F61|nr:phytanoyl-CoA dioxygenase family protein [Pigmentiphaga sp. D-2]
MGRMLSAGQVDAYARQGYVSPVEAFSPRQARVYRDLLESAEQAGGGLSADRRRKMHLYLKWADEIVRHPRVLDAVQDLIGPDILVFHLTCWIKEPCTGAFVSWHQDSTYFGLEPAQHVTAWVALSPSNEESGCVQVVPGSHARGQQRHSAGGDAANMLNTGQRIDVPDDACIDLMQLEPGQFSLHHTHLFHNSMPNRSADRRIGLGISYIPTHCRCDSRQRLSASLVRGVDRHGNFDLDPAPVADFDPQGLRCHEAAMRRWHAARAELIPKANAAA